MKKLRLLITDKCDRNCTGCCNNDYDLDKLPVCESFVGYDEIMLTGGEPMLDMANIVNVSDIIREQNGNALIILYTAKPRSIDRIIDLIRYNVIDSFTLTLHENKDSIDFYSSVNHKYFKVLEELKHRPRLNIFKDVYFPVSYNLLFDIKYNITWIKNCPLPEDEVFMRLTNDHK